MSNVWSIESALEEVRRQSELIQDLAAREARLRQLVELWLQKAQVLPEMPGGKGAALQLKSCAERLERELLPASTFKAREP